MTGSRSVVLEDSLGTRVENPGEEQISGAIEKIGSTLDFCVLHLGTGSYVQTAGDQNRLLIEYSESGRTFASSRTDFDARTVAGVFVDAMQGRNGWKEEYTFTPIGAPGDSGRDREPSDPGQFGEAPGRSAAGTRAEDLSVKDQLLGSVKRQVSREASYSIGSLIRRLIRGFTRRRF